MVDRHDGVAGQRAHHAADDDAVARLQAAVDDAQPAVDQLAGLHLALLDDVLVVDDQHVAALLVVAERDVRHQQRLDVLLLGDAHAHEQARLQDAVLVLEHGARRPACRCSASISGAT